MLKIKQYEIMEESDAKGKPVNQDWRDCDFNLAFCASEEPKLKWF